MLTVMCVDDESNILSSLRRLLRPHGFNVLTASSGAEALGMLEKTSVDVVVSDMQMPEMNGARFLRHVKERVPDVVRILLTGHADLSSTIAAINDAGIYRYVSKPWDDDALVSVVKDALELKLLKQERDRLQALTQQQNAELTDLNTSLESKVRERTAELSDANERLKKSFFTSIKVFSNLIELREGAGAGHSRQIAETSGRVAKRMRLSDDATENIMLAGLLHGIGEFSLPDTLTRKPLNALTSAEQATVRKVPLRTQQALMAVDQLNEAGKLIRSYRERYDGHGYPDGLRHAQVPVGAYILAVVHDYEAAQDGTLTGTRLSQLQATELILAGRGTRYDPDTVDAFVAQLGASGVTAREDAALQVSDVRAGMSLARDLIAPDGMLLLPRFAVLDAARIDELRNYERRDGRAITVHVPASEVPRAF